MIIFDRVLERKIEPLLFKKRAILIFGPRQAGKTTLAKKILEKYSDINSGVDSYFNCDETVIRNYFKLGDPALLKELVGERKLVVFDEAQTIQNIGKILKVFIDKSGYFKSNFVLSKGTVGKVKIEVETHLAENAKTEIETKVFGKNKFDSVEIIDRAYLTGKNSKSLIKMRAAAKNGGKVLMQGETFASAPGAVGHVDCQEIVVGKGSIARAVPIVEVDNDQARVTHEASVGKINQKELETLMTRGLDEDQATELIIEAIMR